MRHFKYVILCAFSLVITGSIFAQENGTLTGIVIDKETGETVIGANVQLATDKSIGTATDIDGKYKLSLPAGKHDVVFSALSLADQTHTVTIVEGKETKLSIEMTVESQQLGAVVVSAGKFEQKVEDLTVSVEIINPSLVEGKGTINAETAIEQTPGVTIVDSEPQIRSGSGYSFGAGSRVMILVDDLPLLSGDAGRPSWGFIPVENLEQIEVIKGASSVLYGSAALNGIINIRTAYPKAEPQTKINYQIGAYDAPERAAAKWWDGGTNPMFTNLNFFHSRKIGQLDLVIGGSGLLDDGFVGPGGTPVLDSLGNETGEFTFPESTTFSNVKNNEGTYEKRARVNANLRYRSKKHEGLSYGVNFNFMKSRSKGSLLWMDSDTNLYRPFPGSDTETKQTTYNIDPFLTIYGRVNHNRHSIRTRIFHQNNDNDNNQANLNYVYFGEYQFQRRVKSVNGLTITAGAMGQYSTSDAELYGGENSAANFAGYAQIDKKFWDKLNLSLGMRYEHFIINDEESQGQPVFRSGLSYRVLKETYLRASFGQGFRFPTIAERFITTTVGGMNIFPSGNLQAEKSFSAEVGIKQGIKLGKFYGYIDLAGFMQQYENTIEFTFGKWGTDSLFMPNPFNPNGDSIYDAVGSITRNLGFRSVNTGGSRVTGIDFSILGQGKFTDNFGLNVLAGYTFTVPITLDPRTPYSEQDQRAAEDTSGQTVTNYVSTSLDTTNNILKYRFQHLVKADVEFTLYRFAFGVSVRYYSFMQNVDKIFYDLDEGDLGPLVGFSNIGIANWRGDVVDPNSEDTGSPAFIFGANKPGDWVADARLSCELSKSSKIALIVNNVLNREYAVRPLAIDAPRSFSIQYTLKF